MSSILKVDQLQDSGGNSIISSNGSGTFTPGSLNIANAQIATAAAIATSKLGTGAVAQMQFAKRTSDFSTTSNSYVDVSNLTFTLTPTSTSSKILVFAFGRSGSAAGSNEIRWRILRDSTTVNAGRDMYSVSGGGIYSASIFCLGVDQPSSTSSLTYKLQGLSENNSDAARIVIANTSEVNQHAYLVGIEIK